MSLSVATITTLSLLPPALLWAAPAAYRRLLLSRAKHRSLTGHSRMAQRVARLLPGYQLDEQRFFCADGCDQNIEVTRRAAFYIMATRFSKRYAPSVEASERAKLSLSDLQFISNYRVPFQFSNLVKSHLKLGSVVSSSHDVFVEDL
ncbi:MAG: glutamate-1-semialdehyde 2,1-aminomutase, partial [Burkholderiaceae bacterium]